MKSYVFLWDSNDFCLQIIYISNHLEYFPSPPFSTTSSTILRREIQFYQLLVLESNEIASGKFFAIAGKVSLWASVAICRKKLAHLTGDRVSAYRTLPLRSGPHPGGILLLEASSYTSSGKGGPELLAPILPEPAIPLHQMLNHQIRHNITVPLLPSAISFLFNNNLVTTISAF